MKISSDICVFETWPAGISAEIGKIETWSAGVIDNLEFLDKHIKTFFTQKMYVTFVVMRPVQAVCLNPTSSRHTSIKQHPDISHS